MNKEELNNWKWNGKVALITGIGGQDGSYLAEFLLSLGYKVRGVVRRSSFPNTKRVDHIDIFDEKYGKTFESPFFMLYGDLSDAISIRTVLEKIRPDEIYNLGAQSHVGISFENPESTFNYNSLGPLRILDAIRDMKLNCRYYQASSITFDTPVLIRKNNIIKRTIFVNTLNLTDFEVLSLDKETKKVNFLPVKRVLDHGFKRVYEVIGRTGLKIKTTSDHSIMIFDDNGKIIEKKTSELKKGDLLITFTGDIIDEKNKSDEIKIDFTLEHNIPSRRGYENKIISKDISYIIKITPELSRLAGYYLAEGSSGIHKNEKRKTGGVGYRVSFCFGSHETERIKDTIEILEKNFNKKPYIQKRKTSITLNYSSKEIYTFISLFGSNAKNKRVPFFVWNLPREIIMELLYGYAGDAHIKKNGQIRYTTVNKELSIDVNYLMRINNISTCCIKRFNKEHYSPQGTIIKEALCYDIKVPTNANFMGLVSVTNQTPFITSGFKSPSSYCLPTEIFKNEKFYYKIKNKKLVSKERLKKLIKQKGLINHKLMGLISSHLGIIQIKDIKYVGEEKVGDYEVPDSETFFCGNQPILAHNSSEMFGISPPPQNEKTPMIPQSPYGIAKLAGYHLTRMYRKAYGVFASNGILFNHETIASFMPMFCKNGGEDDFDIKPIREIVKFNENERVYQSRSVKGIQVLGKGGWVNVIHASAYPHDIKKDNKLPRFINSRSGAFMATSSHVAFMKGGKEKKTGDIEAGDSIEIIEFPDISNASKRISLDEAELIGMMIGDGSITYKKNSKSVHSKFTNSSEKIRTIFSNLWKKVTGGEVRYYPTKSGFNKNKIVGQLRLIGGNDWLRRIDIYNEDRTKRIPKIILNSSKEVMMAFLRGYNLTDGLKSNPCTYEFRNFKTNSATLALGLWYLIDKTTKQKINLTLETKEDGRIFYSLNILTTTDNSIKEKRVKELISVGESQREILRKTSISRTFIRKIQNGDSVVLLHHLSKNPLEVKKIIEMPFYDGWFYDLATSSGEFHCGVGKCHVHNSPRRGWNFVTKKITGVLGYIITGKRDKLVLGNLDSMRDWGYAKEYVQMMWKILQHNEPDDFIISTNETHTVRDFVEEAFDLVGLNWRDYVITSSFYKRPAEVPALLGDCSKAEKILGWRPQIKFKELVKLMVAADLKDKMEKAGIIPVNSEEDNDYYIEKARELAQNLKPKLFYKINANEFNSIFQDLYMILREKNVSYEVLENIKEELSQKLMGKLVSKEDIQRELQDISLQYERERKKEIGD